MAERRTKRERKSTDFFNPVDSPKGDAKTVVGQGHGAKLGDIPNVSFKLDKLKGSSELLESFHQILFKSKGKAHSRKKDIKAFSGFAFGEEFQATELERLEARLVKWTTPQLNSLLDLLDLPRGAGEEGVKDAKVARLKSFLLNPEVASEKDLGAQAAQKREKKEKSKAAKAKKEEAAAKSKAKKEAKSPAAKAKAVKPPAQEGSTGKKRKAPTASEEKPAKKARKQPEKKEPKKAAPKAKPWPPAKDVKADVEFIFQDGLDKGEEMTMGKIYAELATKYAMTVEGIKTKKDQIKVIVKNYEAQLEVEEEEGGKDTAPPDGPQAMDIDTVKAPSSEDVPAVLDKATTEGDENQDLEAAKADAGEFEQPETTEDIQTAVPTAPIPAPSSEEKAAEGAKEAVATALPPPKAESFVAASSEVKPVSQPQIPSQPQGPPPPEIPPQPQAPPPLQNPPQPEVPPQPQAPPQPDPVPQLGSLTQPLAAPVEPKAGPQLVPSTLQEKVGIIETAAPAPPAPALSQLPVQQPSEIHDKANGLPAQLGQVSEGLSQLMTDSPSRSQIGQSPDTGL